ncbi:MAG: alanine--tRNA ligase, partial [Candidatus Omnitrophica bacterium]|nr:alanine--tRNA ligase [Candidatus Omnitrophota bacterium]
MNSQFLREKFLDFFKSKGHKIIPSDSLVPKDDPTVLFTPAGMNQFKSQFLAKKPTLKRVATCQKCLRTDDLEKVGKTPWHHTFFEMLGNFSFGDYFKEEAIEWAWEFLTEVLKIDKNKLWVSVYIEDEESYRIWKEIIKADPVKIVKLDDKHNFWPAEVKLKGPDGPCGPCSEVFFDRGKNFGCGRDSCQPGCRCDRFVEVWNLVFTQFNRLSDGTLEPLPKKNIDTGMGLERLASVIQNCDTNFETDLFRPIVEEIISKLDRDIQKFKEDIYAISDHIRAISFAIADGVIPSNEERGYVVRKLIRKSILHLKRTGIEKAFLYRLVPVVAEIMGSSYPEIKQRRENISEIILREEKNYFSILKTSKIIFREKFKDFLRGEVDEIKAGRIAFQIYDTYGIPFELTQNFAMENNFKISKEEFENQLELQRLRSQQLSKIEKKVFVSSEELNLKPTKFLGYQLFETKI